MNPDGKSTARPTSNSFRRIFRTLLVVGAALWLGSCSAFNPAFVDVVVPGGGGASIDNAPGHVVIQFVNNAEVNERLLSYLESEEGGGLVLTDAEKRDLRPRIRMRLLITYTDGSQTTVELIDGSENLISPPFADLAEADLTENELDNAVVLCDVAQVDLLPGSEIDVFIPTPIIGYEFVLLENAIVPTVAEGFLPSFRSLRVDQVDMDGNIQVRNNIDVREVFTPVNNIICGTVVTIILEGELAVPFLFNDFPSYDINVPNSIGSIGGRYQFIVGVQ